MLFKNSGHDKSNEQKIIEFYSKRAKLQVFKDRDAKWQPGEFCNLGGCNLAGHSLFQVFFAAFFMFAWTLVISKI